ncbi:FxsA family protein [Microbaculum marinum]|uniref:FxsA family protein n=1 Tax=Microbaculum marinum TaxID=1764581 RepID=A0AAW9RZ40_9HYPH
MGLILFALFVGVPVAEIALFVLVGGEIGVLATIAIVILTAVAGAALVRHQGIETAMRARRDMESNRIPAGALTEGLAILVAGVLLLTPGFLTDAIGFALLVPPVRRSLIKWVGAWLAARVTVVDMASRGAGGPGRGYGGGNYRGGDYRGRDDVIEGEAVEIDPDAESDDEEARRSLSDRRNGGSSPWRPS